MNTRLRSALRWVRAIFYVSVGALTTIVPRRSGDAALIVRLDAIGDFVIWLQSGAADVTLELRARHPSVLLLANATWAPLAVELGIWDRVIPIDPARFLRSLRYRVQVLVKLRRLGFNTLVQPRAARIFALEDCLVRASGAPERVGSMCLTANMPPELKRLGDRSYSGLINVPGNLTVHESIRGKAFAQNFCKGRTGAVIEPPRTTDITTLFNDSASSYLVVAVGAGWSGRQWPIEKFASLLSALHAIHRLPCVLIGSLADKSLSSRLSTLTTAPIHDLCGEVSLLQSLALIERCRLVVANESGPMHMAAWCRKPVVGIVGGGHFGWFAPYPIDARNVGQVRSVVKPMPCFNCNWKCIFPVELNQAVPCVRDIEVDAVLRTVDELLAV